MNRQEIAQKYKWDLSSIIKSDKEWETLFSKVVAEHGAITDYKGKLNNSDSIYNCFQLDDAIGKDLENLFVYAKMKMDEDANINIYQAMVDRVSGLSVKISSLASFINPELCANSDEKLLQFSKEQRFAEYDYVLSKIIINKPHILSQECEQILAEVGNFSDGFHDAYNMFDNADIKFDPISMNGEVVEMSHGVYGSALQNDDRDAREQAFTSMFSAFKGMINTISQLYSGNVKKNVFYAKTRKFNASLERAMHAENVPSTVYNKLIHNVQKALPSMHDYINYRKDVLGYDTLNMWDLHVSIVDGANIELEYEDAYELVMKALAPLGSEYANLLKKAFNESWIDVCESKGKRSGAYSWGSYTSHPYVLLNYKKVTHDVFTIAHEMGHAMHSFYSNTTQPYAKAGYEIFVAEVASTVNEVLLLKYLISNSDEHTKKFLLSYYLDMFRTTLFRQTQFAMFEQKAHELAEQDEPLTPEVLNGIYYELNKDFYGTGVEHNNLIKYEWARIPHFYRSFYVYKYATGITSAVTIASKILNEGQPALDQYMEFLSLGGSMPPVEILKVAGVDLTKDEPFEICFSEFNKTLEELKKFN